MQGDRDVAGIAGPTLEPGNGVVGGVGAGGRMLCRARIRVSAVMTSPFVADPGVRGTDSLASEDREMQRTAVINGPER